MPVLKEKNTLFIYRLWICLLLIIPGGALFSGSFDSKNNASLDPALQPASIKITFNDPRLELAVRNALGKPDGDIEETDMAGLTNLSVQNDSIADLTGLEYAINLKNLVLSNNRISNLAPLQNLTSLNNLTIDNNKISDISPLANLINLNNINLASNQIATLSPLQNLTNLAMLYAQNNPLGSITNLENLTNLVLLSVDNCQINDISVLQNFTQLKFLYMNDNKIQDFTPLLSLANMQNLRLALTGIKDLSVFQNMTQLIELNVSYNDIRDISPLQSFSKLQVLQLRSNNLDHDDLLTLYNLDQLKSLNIRRNPGMISGTAVQTLVDNLDSLECENILWDGICGIDPNAAAICWVDPDTANINELVTVHITATDTNQSRIQTRIDWDDNVISEYSKFEENASVFTLTYSYTQAGYYHIRGMAKNEGGKETPWSSSVSIVILDNGSAIHQADQLACEFSLAQNYPNPFNATTAIHYTLPRNGHVTLRIFNLAGQEIDCPLNSIQTAGEHTIIWQGRTGAGQSVPSGIYIYQVATDSFTQNRKMILLR